MMERGHDVLRLPALVTATCCFPLSNKANVLLQLALTHFCEAHGPKSVLCTQVLPLECALCLPPSPPLRARSSSDSLHTQVQDSPLEHQPGHISSLQKSDTNLTLPTDFSGASTTVESEPASPKVEKHPFPGGDAEQKHHSSPPYRSGRTQADTCASCSFSVPHNIADRLPAGFPGSKNSDGKSNDEAPVLRSREFVCVGGFGESSRRRSVHHHHQRTHSTSEESVPSSFGSLTSCRSEDCHDHTLTYLTAKSPEDPGSYAQLRASVIRTLSCELLPRGMSDGPMCFGDSNAGYTIAYVFRLTDPKARGRRRAYAFVALAGKDASRAFQASPMVWEAFASMAKGIEQAAQRHQDEQRLKEEQERESGKQTRNYTPVSSFLTQRAVDPDGHPRRIGQTTPRSLAEIVGDENIFTILHQFFVAILKCLGDRFGGLPLADKPSVYQTVADELGFSRDKIPTKLHAEMVEHLDKLRDDDVTPTPQKQPPPKDDLEVAKTRVNKNIKLHPQCAPLAVAETAQRQVVV